MSEEISKLIAVIGGIVTIIGVTIKSAHAEESGYIK
jgi:hypothetical protein